MKRNYTTYIIMEIVLGFIIILGILFLLTHDVKLFFSILYSPYSFLLMIVILLEYIILKGMDRSRIYKLEIQRLKQKRQKDMEFHQKLEKRIQEIHSILPDSDVHQGIRKKFNDILNSLKEL